MFERWRHPREIENKPPEHDATHHGHCMAALVCGNTVVFRSPNLELLQLSEVGSDLPGSLQPDIPPKAEESGHL